MDILLDKLLTGVYKPARYIGGEINSVIKDWDKTEIRFAIALADTYEVGMSNLGINIIYELLNSRDDILAERVFVPWPDFESKLRNSDFALYSLESKRPIMDFDFFGISLPTEFTFINTLTLLDLAKIPFFPSGRNNNFPIVFAGGSATFNPEPVADFFDFITIGESEEVLFEIFDLYKKLKNEPRQLFFEELARNVEGVYVPSLYEVVYDKDGGFENIKPKIGGVPQAIKKRLIYNLDRLSYPKKPITPITDIIHNRAVLEIMRGCMHKCRFCQAAYTTLPVREFDVEQLKRRGVDILNATGHEEISLVSLSSSDYSNIDSLSNYLMQYCKDKNISISLPALRLDSFSDGLAAKAQEVRSSGVTLAPEAGSQRMRDVINKKISEEDILKGIKTAADRGIRNIKLYFMIGLPFENDEDIKELLNIVYKIERLIKETIKSKFKIVVNLSTFIPKPHTPFQWSLQARRDEVEEKQNYIKSSLKSRHIEIRWTDPNLSVLEGVLARGDRKLSKVMVNAWQKGARLDGWHEHFDFVKWEKAFSEEGIDYLEYLKEIKDVERILPWDHIDTLVRKDFLIKEYLNAKNAATTLNCIKGCKKCGVCK